MICIAINSVALFLHEGNVHSSPSRHLSTINYLKTFLRLTETVKKKRLEFSLRVVTLQDLSETK